MTSVHGGHLKTVVESELVVVERVLVRGPTVVVAFVATQLGIVVYNASFYCDTCCHVSRMQYVYIAELPVRSKG